MYIGVWKEQQASMRPIQQSLPKLHYTLACAQLMGFLGMLACRLTLVYYWLEDIQRQAVFIDVLSTLEVQLCLILLLLSRSDRD